MRRFLIITVLLMACQKESRIEIPYEGDKIVVNSFIQPDSLIYIRVTMSKQVRETGNLQFTGLDDAAVTLQEDGATLPPPRWQVINGQGYFVSSAAAHAGKLYTIQAASDRLTAVYGADSTPVRPQLKNASAQRGTNRVRFSLFDDGAITNYYRIRIYKADTINGVLTANKKDTVRFRLDPAFNNDFSDIIGISYRNEFMITDELINGKDVQFVLQTEKEVSAASMIVEVSALTKGAWLYLKATYDQRLNDGQDFSFDPVNIYSNVENGYGIIAGVNAARLGFAVE